MAAGTPHIVAEKGHSSDDLQSLAPSLGLAVKACMAQLQALRTSTTVDKQTATYAAEERALKLSLSSLIASVAAVREAGQARRSTLLLAVLPTALQLLSTPAVLPLTQTSAAVRASISAGREARALLLPHLDAAPRDPAECKSFLLDRVALGSVRWLALPAAASSTLLSHHSFSLSAVESLALPCGCFDFAGLPHLTSLRCLTVDAQAITDSATVSRLAASLSDLPRPLSHFEISGLASALVIPLLDAIVSGGLVYRLTFKQCTMLDNSVSRVCSALVQSETLGEPLVGVHFEECGLTEQAEQQLLTMLEQCDGMCRVSMDGSIARSRDDADEDAEPSFVNKGQEVKQALVLGVASGSRSCGSKDSVSGGEGVEMVLAGMASGLAMGSQALPNGSQEAMSLQGMLAMALMRLQEEQTPDALFLEAPRQQAVSPREDCGPRPGESFFAEEFVSSRKEQCSHDDTQEPRRSRFGFAFDDIP